MTRHTVGDGRGRRRVFVDGAEVAHPIWADTQAGIVECYTEPLRKTSDDELATEIVRGRVEVVPYGGCHMKIKAARLITGPTTGRIEKGEIRDLPTAQAQRLIALRMATKALRPEPETPEAAAYPTKAIHDAPTEPEGRNYRTKQCKSK
ncbi:MAG TPA: hypothetical protein VK110_11305 [Salinisphaeraceae bacterium]|nr:hypothetical protein [Salinisphaeraceae bacterium]